MEVVQQAAVAFLQADTNGDQMLDFEEFKEVLPPELRGSDDEVKEIFDMCDADKSGTITQDEFFFWSVQMASEFGGNHMQALQDQFKKYDATGDGQLNSLEFRKAVEPFGFGAMAHDIFVELDIDGTGTVSYMELIQTLKARRTEVSEGSKRLLTAMSFDLMNQEKQELPKFDTTPWKAASTVELRTELCRRMSLVVAKPYALWRALLEKSNAKKKLKLKQFAIGLHFAVGFEEGQDDVVKECFQEMDENDAMLINFDSFINWMNGRPMKKRMATVLTLQHGRDPVEPPLESIDWNFINLRTEIQKMLLRANATPLDLMLTYDNSEDGSLSKKEFIVMMKKIVNDEQLWATSNVKETCADLYESISGGDNSMDIEELERWAMKNWMEMKRDFADGRFDNIASKRASPVSPSSSRASPTTTSVATSPIKFGQGAPQSLSPPIPRTFDAVYPSIGGTAGSKSTGSLLVNATDTPPPLRIEDKHRALEEARRLRAAAQKAAEDAMRAQARAKRLIIAAAYAEEAASAAENTVRQFRESAGKSLRSQDTRAKMMQDRHRREIGQPNKFFSNALSLEAQSSTRPQLVPRPGTASSKSALSRSSSRPSTATMKPNRLHVNNPVVVKNGPMVGLPNGRPGSGSVPYWA